MSTRLATIPDLPLTPQPASRMLLRTLDVVLSGATEQGGRLALLPGKELRPDEELALRARSSTLARSLAHRDAGELARIIAGLFAAFPSGKATPDEARTTMGAYVAVLGDLPPWAVAEAAKAWLRGGHGAVASAFAPSAAQLHEAAAHRVAAFWRELNRIDSLLSAVTTEPDAAERRRVADGFERLQFELRRPQPGA